MIRSLGSLGIALSAAGAAAAGEFPAVGNIERKDPRFDKLIPKDAKLEKLADGFAWTEGPVWVKDGGYLLFSDIPNNVVIKWKEGRRRQRLPQAGRLHRQDARDGGEPGSNGLTLDAEGRLVLCEHGDRRVAAHREGRQEDRLADKYEGKRLNSPNDLRLQVERRPLLHRPAVRPARRTRTTRPASSTSTASIACRKDGKLTLLTKEMTRPNGIAFSPDEKTLYVANSDPRSRDLDGVPRQGRRHARQGQGVLRRHDVGRQEGRRACPTA